MPGEAHSKSAVEERTRHWLEANYLTALSSLPDAAHGVFDSRGQPRNLTAYVFQEVHRKLKIFRWLDRFDFATFIDVGSGFDRYPNLVRERYGARAYFSDFAHSMNLPYGGEEYGRLDHAITLNIGRLPFADDTFDAVLSSEVLEHLVSPVEAIAELLRVTRKYLVMTSLEALSIDRWRRLLSHLRVDVRQPHVERNFFLLGELEAIFGADWQHENLFYDPALPVSSLGPPADQEPAYRALRDTDAFVEALCRSVAVADHRPGSMGILIVKTRHGAALRPAARDDRALARWLIDRTAAGQAALYRLAEQVRAGTAPLPDRDRPIAAELVALVRCPDCRGALVPTGSSLRCPACQTSFLGEYGVPVLYPARSGNAGRDAQWLSRLCAGDARRMRTVARVVRRLRRNERQPGALRRLLWGADRLIRRG
jgi:SAM-dependent methyltransferase